MQMYSMYIPSLVHHSSRGANGFLSMLRAPPTLYITTNTHTHTHVHTRARARAHTHTHTHAYTNTHTHTHTHTQTHTHTSSAQTVRDTRYILELFF